ncbi:hypothetical protein ACLMAB_24855 [Brevibacillus laterosporus]
MPTNNIQKSMAAAKTAAQSTIPKTKSSVLPEYSYANKKNIQLGWIASLL